MDSYILYLKLICISATIYNFPWTKVTQSCKLLLMGIIPIHGSSPTEVIWHPNINARQLINSSKSALHYHNCLTVTLSLPPSVCGIQVLSFILYKILSSVGQGHLFCYVWVQSLLQCCHKLYSLPQYNNNARQTWSLEWDNLSKLYSHFALQDSS